MRISSRSFALTVLAAVIAFGTGTAIAASGDTIHACVVKASGTIRIVESPASCRPSEQPLDWERGATGTTAAGPTVIEVGYDAASPCNEGEWIRRGESCHTAYEYNSRAIRNEVTLDGSALAGHGLQLEFTGSVIGQNELCARLFDVTTERPVPNTTTCHASVAPNRLASGFAAYDNFRISTSTFSLPDGPRDYIVQAMVRRLSDADGHIWQGAVHGARLVAMPVAG